jgi:hypothetical protein
MLIWKVISVVTACGLGAAAVLAFPGFSPEVEAGTPPQAVKADRLDIRPLGAACSQQAWPYFEASCLRDLRQVPGQVRQVRLVTTDRLAK